MLSFDPGGKHLGWALWSGGVLTDAGRSVAKAKCYRERAQEHWSRVVVPHIGDRIVAVRVGEAMRIRGFGSPQDPQDLVDLSLISGHIGNVWYEPSEWKGGLTPEMEQERTKDRLTPSERAIWDKLTKKVDCHVKSAIGIGLHHLGRGWMPLRGYGWAAKGGLR